MLAFQGRGDDDECPHATAALDFGGATLRRNKRSGALRFKGAGEQDGVAFDVVVRDAGGDTVRGGLSASRYFGMVEACATTSLSLNISFEESATGRPLTVGSAYVTLYDVDNPRTMGGGVATREIVEVAGLSAYYVSGRTRLGSTLRGDDGSRLESRLFYGADIHAEAEQLLATAHDEDAAAALAPTLPFATPTPTATAMPTTINVSATAMGVSRALRDDVSTVDPSATRNSVTIRVEATASLTIGFSVVCPPGETCAGVDACRLLLLSGITNGCPVANVPPAVSAGTTGETTSGDVEPEPYAPCPVEEPTPTPLALPTPTPSRGASRRAAHCAALCPAGVCDSIKDAHKPECAACSACHASSGVEHFLLPMLVAAASRAEIASFIAEIFELIGTDGDGLTLNEIVGCTMGDDGHCSLNMPPPAPPTIDAGVGLVNDSVVDLTEGLVPLNIFFSVGEVSEDDTNNLAKARAVACETAGVVVASVMYNQVGDAARLHGRFYDTDPWSGISCYLPSSTSGNESGLSGYPRSDMPPAAPPPPASPWDETSPDLNFDQITKKIEDVSITTVTYTATVRTATSLVCTHSAGGGTCIQTIGDAERDAYRDRVIAACGCGLTREMVGVQIIQPTEGWSWADSPDSPIPNSTTTTPTPTPTPSPTPSPSPTPLEELDFSLTQRAMRYEYPAPWAGHRRRRHQEAQNSSRIRAPSEFGLFEHHHADSDFYTIEPMLLPVGGMSGALSALRAQQQADGATEAELQVVTRIQSEGANVSSDQVVSTLSAVLDSNASALYGDGVTVVAEDVAPTTVQIIQNYTLPPPPPPPSVPFCCLDTFEVVAANDDGKNLSALEEELNALMPTNLFGDEPTALCYEMVSVTYNNNASVFYGDALLASPSPLPLLEASKASFKAATSFSEKTISTPPSVERLADGSILVEPPSSRSFFGDRVRSSKAKAGRSSSQKSRPRRTSGGGRKSSGGALSLLVPEPWSEALFHPPPPPLGYELTCADVDGRHDLRTQHEGGCNYMLTHDLCHAAFHSVLADDGTYEGEVYFCVWDEAREDALTGGDTGAEGTSGGACASGPTITCFAPPPSPPVTPPVTPPPSSSVTLRFEIKTCLNVVNVTEQPAAYASIYAEALELACDMADKDDLGTLIDADGTWHVLDTREVVRIP